MLHRMVIGYNSQGEPNLGRLPYLLLMTPRSIGEVNIEPPEVVRITSTFHTTWHDLLDLAREKEGFRLITPEGIKTYHHE